MDPQVVAVKEIIAFLGVVVKRGAHTVTVCVVWVNNRAVLVCMTFILRARLVCKH
jgi:hypothetical protein